MKLSKVKISNFRSIPEDTTINLIPTCRILVGVNEVGKSNILKAMALLEKDKALNKQDIREQLPGESPIKTAEVSFVFKLNHNEISSIFKDVLSNILSKNIKSPIIKNKDKPINLFEFMLMRNEVLYVVDLVKQKRDAYSWSLDEEDFEIISDWKKLKKDNNATIGVGDKLINLNVHSIVNVKDYPNIANEHLEDLTVDDVYNLFVSKYNSYLEENLPNCIFWNYKEENLLPSKIDLSQFLKDSKICLPLKHMFELAKYEDIPQAFKDAEERSPTHGINNLLERVARITTSYFRGVWKNHNKIEFSLTQNGNFIDAGIKEMNKHSFERRSDGFKRFVTFLLMVSTRVNRGNVRNELILIDEPDISLHISASEYLKDELIKISKTNYVVYSTHSIFMIDDKDIAKHIIVDKVGEKTILKDAKESDIYDEEVLCNALGYSLFRNLKEKNIIFEGWRDKKLFKTALNQTTQEFVSLKSKFKNVGLAHSKGVLFMKRISPILELANRQVLILSDNDEAAIREQKKFESNKLWGSWARYDQLINDKEKITAEDFLEKSFVKGIWNSMTGQYKDLKTVNNIDEMENPKGVLYSLKKLAQENYSDEKVKDLLDNFKEKLYEKVIPQNISKSYYTYLVEAEKIVNSK